MRYPPLSVQESWPPANYVDPITRGPTLIIVQMIILPLAWICLALRMWVRFVILRRSGWDDYLMIVATVFATGVTASLCLATQKYGWNLHVWDVMFENLENGRKISIAGQTLFIFASGFAKISILLSYLRIASRGTKFRFFTICTLTLVIACLAIFLVVIWTQCVPAYAYWNLLQGNQFCEFEGVPAMGQVSTSIATDLLVYVLPMPILYQLKLPLVQRISLMIVFGLGGIVVIAGCMRLYWTYYTVYETYDVTWYGFNVWIWTAVEVNLGIICGCAPSLKPIIFEARSRLSSVYNKSQLSGSTWKKSLPTDTEMDVDEDRMESIQSEKTLHSNEKMRALSLDETACTCSFHTPQPLPPVKSCWVDADREEKETGYKLPKEGENLPPSRSPRHVDVGSRSQ